MWLSLFSWGFCCSVPCLIIQPCQYISINDSRAGGVSKHLWALISVRALKISMLYKNYIFQCMGKIFCVEVQRLPQMFWHLTHCMYNAGCKIRLDLSFLPTTNEDEDMFRSILRYLECLIYACHYSEWKEPLSFMITYSVVHIGELRLYKSVW